MGDIEKHPTGPEAEHPVVVAARLAIKKSRIDQATADYDMMSQVLKARTNLGPSVLDAESGVPQSQAHPAEDT